MVGLNSMQKPWSLEYDVPYKIIVVRVIAAIDMDLFLCSKRLLFSILPVGDLAKSDYSSEEATLFTTKVHKQ